VLHARHVQGLYPYAFVLLHLYVPSLELPGIVRSSSNDNLHHMPGVFSAFLLHVQAVSQGLGPKEALRCVVQQVEAAGGSFKALQKQLHKQAPKTHKQLASAGGDAAAASAAAAAAVGYAGVGYTGFAISPLMGTYSDLQLAAGKGGKGGKGEKGGSNAAVLRLSASTADDDAGDAAVGGMAGVLNPVLQPLSLAEGLVAGCKTPAGMREVMSHPVAWADAAELDD
jgi:hypothetical protein